jgi:hypothetical protein
MIGRAYRWLFDAHRHDWEILKDEPFYRWATFEGKKVKTGEGTLYTLRCKSCGDITARRSGVEP